MKQTPPPHFDINQNFLNVNPTEATQFKSLISCAVKMPNANVRDTTIQEDNNLSPVGLIWVSGVKRVIRLSRHGGLLLQQIPSLIMTRLDLIQHIFI